MFDALALIARECLRYGMREPAGCLLLASVDVGTIRIINRILGVPLRVIGDSFGPFGGVDAPGTPILIDIAKCVDVFSLPKARRGAFFLEGFNHLTAEW